MAWNAKYLHNLTGGPGDAMNIWSYRDTVAASAVRVDGYMADASQRGVRLGDVVNYQQVNDQDNPTAITAVTIHFVIAVNADHSVDLTDGLAVTATNTD